MCDNFIWKESTNNKALWISFSVSIIFGFFLGILSLKVKKIGTFLVGGWFGYVLSLILYAIFLHKIQTNPP